MIELTPYIPVIEPSLSIAPLVLGGLIGAAGSIIGNGISGLFSSGSSAAANKANIAAVQEQNKGNMELAEYQYDKNLEMWNLQNEYNSPAAQMARYRAAGLNPNLAIGNAGNASSAPSYSVPAMERATINPVSSPLAGFAQGIAPAISAYQNMQLTQQQIDLAKEQVTAARQQNSQFALRNSILGLRYQQDLAKYGFYQDSYGHRLNQALYRASLLANNVELAKGNLLLQEKRGRLLDYQYDSLYPAQLGALNALTKIRNSQASIFDTQAELWDAGINPNNQWLLPLGRLMGDTLTEFVARARGHIKKFFFDY